VRLRWSSIKYLLWRAKSRVNRAAAQPDHRPKSTDIHHPETVALSSQEALLRTIRIFAGMEDPAGAKKHTVRVKARRGAVQVPLPAHLADLLALYVRVDAAICFLISKVGSEGELWREATL